MTTKPFHFFLAAAVLTAWCSCASGGADVSGGGAAASPEINAQSPEAGQTTAPNRYFSGDGGKELSIAILAPQAAGLAQGQDYIPALVQGELVSNFSGYSAISVLDRQRLNDQYAELLSGYYDDNAQAGQDLGHLTPTTHIMAGSITRTATGYALQITVTRSADKMTAASYSETCTFAELDNLSGIRRASLALLEKMGVTPTEQTRTELAGAAARHEINAQTTLAQGITAQQGGTEIAALSYYIQSSGFDPNLTEAASRLNIITASVTSGDMGANIRNDLQWRDQWLARLKECEEFFAKNVYGPYPYYLVYSTNIVEGKTDYEKRTVDLSVTISSYPDMPHYKAIGQVVDTVLKGLQATGRAKIWGLDEWPKKTVAIPNLLGFEYGSGKYKYHDMMYCSGYTAVVEIINSEGKSIASKAVGFPQGFGTFSDFDSMSTPRVTKFVIPIKAAAVINFPSVDPNDMTQTMAIRIASINGQSAESWAGANRLSILSEGDLPTGVARRADKDNAYSSTTLLRRNDDPGITRWRDFDVYHHGVPITAISDWGAINIFPVTSQSLSNVGSYNSGNNSSYDTAYFPGHNATIPASIVDNISIYLGANLTLINGARKEYTSLIDSYNKNGKKEGWYVYGEKSYTYLPR
jgi:hypothetical protein